MLPHENPPLAPPQALLPALDALHQVFSRLLPGVPIVMGGGSVLAARWHHRDSTDIDLFVSPATMVALTNEKRMFYHAVQVQLENWGKVNIDAVSGFLSGKVCQTPCTVAASEFISNHRQASIKVGATNFQAATNQEILSGKIQGRMHRRGVRPASTPIRDLYDIVVAAHLDPGVVDRILREITPKGRVVIADDLRRLPGNLHETDSKPIINPQYQINLEGLPALVADAVEAGNETLLPEAKHISQDSTSDSDRPAWEPEP